MRTILILATALAIAGSALATDAGERTKLFGNWHSATGEVGTSWTIEDKGDSILIVQTQSSKDLIRFQCKPGEAECKGKSSGKNATSALYFNGPALVQMETRGSDVLKRRFLSTGEDTMDVEIVPISPAGKTETLKFRRATLSAGSN